MSPDPAPPDERELIEWIRHQRPMPPPVIVGPGDDAAALLLPPSELCVVTTDSVIAGVHFDPASASPEQIGHKAVARSVSDLAAMVAQPVAVLAACNFPRGADLETARGIVRGMLALTDRLGIALVGGDIAVHDGPLAVTVTAVGSAPPNRIVLRSGARKGDILCVTGELGGSILGRHLGFIPRVAEAQWIARHNPVHSMIDISDGLLLDASRLARESRVGLVIDPVLVPISADAHQLARTSGRTALEHALGDGEDYELLFTVPHRALKTLIGVSQAPVRVTVIGEAVEGSGLWLRKEGVAPAPVEPAGWIHQFRPAL